MNKLRLFKQPREGDTGSQWAIYWKTHTNDAGKTSQFYQMVTSGPWQILVKNFNRCFQCFFICFVSIPLFQFTLISIQNHIWFAITRRPSTTLHCFCGWFYNFCWGGCTRFMPCDKASSIWRIHKMILLSLWCTSIHSKTTTRRAMMKHLWWNVKAQLINKGNFGDHSNP